jgi:glycine/D-amino acid oxidase-like deaminating enzyme
MPTYSHIVVGAGGLGTAAAYWLAKSGCRDVLVLEQFELGNGRGASEDHSRIIRHSYHSADYTALTPAAYESWDELEEETGLRLVLRTGGPDLATLGTPGLDELANYRAALRAAGIPWEDLDASEVRSRYPQWQIEDAVVGMYQQDTGVLDIQRSARCSRSRARRASPRCGSPARRCSSTGACATAIRDGSPPRRSAAGFPRRRSPRAQPPPRSST